MASTYFSHIKKLISTISQLILVTTGLDN